MRSNAQRHWLEIAAGIVHPWWVQMGKESVKNILTSQQGTKQGQLLVRVG